MLKVLTWVLKQTSVIKPKDFGNQHAIKLNKEEKSLAHLAQKALEDNKGKPSLLPLKTDDKLTVVFELDEVLAFTFVPNEEGYLNSPRRKSDFHCWFSQYETLIDIHKRKNLDNFLHYVNEECEPVIFSRGVRSYVQLVLGLIDPQKLIKHVITQEHCSRVVDEEEGIDEFLKDLSLLGRDLSRVVYFDSKVLSPWLQPDNYFPLQQFRADVTMKSEDLDYLLLEIETLRHQQDVRQLLRARFQLEQKFKQIHLL